MTTGPRGLAPILVSRVIAKIKELKERKRLTVLMAEQNAPIKRYYLGA